MEVKCGSQSSDCLRGGEHGPQGHGVKSPGQGPKTIVEGEAAGSAKDCSVMCWVVSELLAGSTHPTWPTTGPGRGLGRFLEPGTAQGTARSSGFGPN